MFMINQENIRLIDLVKKEYQYFKNIKKKELVRF